MLTVIVSLVVGLGVRLAGKSGAMSLRERERERERRQDYFIVRPPAHYNRSEHSGNSNSHGFND